MAASSRTDGGPTSITGRTAPLMSGAWRSSTRTLTGPWRLTDIALAANEAIGVGEVPASRLVFADTGGRIVDGGCDW